MWASASRATPCRRTTSTALEAHHALAIAGARVVRLKGGDPFVFGRGGEELATLRAVNIPTHVVPGVTAAFAAAASAGAPLTHRGMAQTVTFVTGHAAKGEEPDLDWASLARGNQSVVVYMGLSTAPVIAAKLIEAGRAGSTPVLVVEGASLPDERRVLTTLGGLGEAVEGLDGPAILLIGEVAALSSERPREGGDPSRLTEPQSFVSMGPRLRRGERKS